MVIPVIDPGYFRVAYTVRSVISDVQRVIDPGYFRVAYTISYSLAGIMTVIDPGYFRVAYTWVSKTSLYNKV